MVKKENCLARIAEDYEFDLERVKSLYEEITAYDFVVNYPEEMSFDCLETMISDIVTEELISEQETSIIGKKSLEFIKADAICKVYGDIAIPFLPKDYIFAKYLNGRKVKRRVRRK